MGEPVFHSVIDLGLRDVGVVNRPRRFAANFGKGFVPIIAAAVLFAVVACMLLRAGVSPLLVVLAWPAMALKPALRMLKRSPVLVMKITADGRNQAWLAVVPALLVLGMALVNRTLPAIPMAVVALVTAWLHWRGRGRVPEVVRTLQAALAADEPVLGDGIGQAPGARPRGDALRALAATDRRMLVAGRTGMLLDVPYGYISRFGIEWKLRGRIGTLSLTAGEVTCVVAAINPANLLSIAQGLRARGVVANDPAVIDEAQRGWEEALRRGADKQRRGRRLARIAAVLVTGLAGLVLAASATGFELSSLPLAVQEATAKKLPVDGHSNLTGGAASLAYTPSPGLRELRTDEHWDAAPDDGARWELRSHFTKGYNVVTLSHYVFALDDRAAVAAFVAGKDREQSRIAGFRVSHRERVVDGRTGYVWEYRSHRGYWQFAAWFPQPVHSVRVECIAKTEVARFERLCAEAMGSLRFRP